MKRILALLLTVSLLLGLMGTTAFAAEAAAPVLGVPSVDADGKVSMTVTGGDDVSEVDVWFETSDGDSAGYAWLYKNSETGKFEGNGSSRLQENYADATPSSFTVYMSGGSDTKYDEANKTETYAYAYHYFYYDGDRNLTSADTEKTELVSVETAWKYQPEWADEPQEYTDYATTSYKNTRTNVYYENGKETGSSVTTEVFNVKLAKTPENTYINNFYPYTTDDYGYTVTSASKERTEKGTRTSKSDDGKLTTTTTSDLKTTYKLVEEKKENSSGEEYTDRDFVEDAWAGTQTTTRKGTRESYTWSYNEETGDWDIKNLYYTEAVDEETTSTYTGDARTTVTKENNKTTYADGRVEERQAATTSTAKRVERENGYDPSEKEKAWETSATQSESKSTSYREDGTKSRVVTSKQDNTVGYYKYFGYSDPDKYWWDDRTKASEAETTTEEYDSKGVYSGKEVRNTKSEYDLESGIELKSDSKTLTYNKDNVLKQDTAVVSEKTLNSAKTAYTQQSSEKTKNYSDKGMLTSSSETETTTEAKKKDGYSWFSTTSEKTNEKDYNRDNVLSREYSSTTVNNDDNSSTQTYTYKYYNTFTKAITEERTTTRKQDADYNTTTDYTYTYNNDDGTLRRKSVRNADGSEIHYNSEGKVVATRDKNDMDGTWKDGSGKVIGKNDRNSSEDGTGQTTSVYFKSRTGDISGYDITTVTKKDGVTTETSVEYEDGKKTSEQVTVTQADGSWKRTTDGVVRATYDAEKNEHRYYDYKGNLSRYETYDPENDTYAGYNYKGVMTYQEKNTSDGYEYWYYDSEGNVEDHYAYSYENSTETYYDAKDNVLWTASNVYEDDTSYRVYKDKNGKEFARTYEKSDWKNEDNGYSSTYTNQHVYDGNGSSISDYASGSITLEKREYKQTYTSTADGSTRKETTKYTKWDVVNGKEQDDKVTRKVETTTKSDSNGYESKTYTDGVLTYSNVEVNNEYGDTAKSTRTYYDAYTGRQENKYKTIYSDVDDDPVHFEKYYDKYDNLQTYSKIDNTDRWNWRLTYYANGTLKQEYWYDGLDYESHYQEDYYLSGDPSYKYTQNGDVSTTVRYNRDGSYSSWADTVNGVTNTYVYDSHGAIKGYVWNEKEITEDNGDWNETIARSYDYYDANENLIYKYQSEELASGWTTSYTDAAGNKLVYSDGEWTLTTAAKLEDGWASFFGDWFYILNGKPVQGDWVKYNGDWYYFGWDGRMTTGIRPYYAEDGNTYIYAMDKDGVLVSGGFVQMNDEGTAWAYTAANGEVQTGWVKIGGDWYYFDEGWYYNKTDYKQDAYWYQSDYRGYMATGATKIFNDDGTTHTYFFTEDGVYDTTPGWKIADFSNDEGRPAIEYHYYNNRGVEAVGWQEIDGEWYFFNEDGVLKTGWVQSGPNWYFMDPAKQGALADDGWVDDIYEGRYYMNADGSMKIGWAKIDGTWYYFNSDGDMATKQWVPDGDTWYYMDENGLLAVGWQKINGSWYYFNDDNSLATNKWLQSGADWYYFGADGVMVTGEVEIDGQVSIFNADGAWTAYK